MKRSIFNIIFFLSIFFIALKSFASDFPGELSQYDEQLRKIEMELLTKYKVDKDKVVKVLKSIFDPELPVSIYDLGLIYKIYCSERGNVQIEMSLTAPACPVAGELPKEVSEKVSALDKVGEVTVKLVWVPSWSKDMMSDDAKLLLDM